MLELADDDRDGAPQAASNDDADGIDAESPHLGSAALPLFLASAQPIIVSSLEDGSSLTATHQVRRACRVDRTACPAKGSDKAACPSPPHPPPHTHTFTHTTRRLCCHQTFWARLPCSSALRPSVVGRCRVRTACACPTCPARRCCSDGSLDRVFPPRSQVRPPSTLLDTVSRQQPMFRMTRSGCPSRRLVLVDRSNSAPCSTCTTRRLVRSVSFPGACGPDPWRRPHAPLRVRLALPPDSYLAFPSTLVDEDVSHHSMVVPEMVSAPAEASAFFLVRGPGPNTASSR